MGTLKKFAGGIAQEQALVSLWVIPNQSDSWTSFNAPTCNYTTIDNTSCNAIEISSSKYKSVVLRQGALLCRLEPIATGDSLTDYNVTDGSITGLGTMGTVTTSSAIDGYDATQIFSFAVTNSTASDIVVKCIKFKRNIPAVSGTTSSLTDVLTYGYYLDEPVTITAGTSHNFTISLTTAGLPE